MEFLSELSHIIFKMVILKLFRLRVNSINYDLKKWITPHIIYDTVGVHFSNFYLPVAIHILINGK